MHFMDKAVLCVIQQKVSALFVFILNYILLYFDTQELNFCEIFWSKSLYICIVCLWNKNDFHILTSVTTDFAAVT